MASDDLSLFSNLALDDAATSASTGTVCEPTAASSGADLLVTGNWFASRSSDAGQSWQFVDPETLFPASMGGFCCDQVALYEPSRDLWIWLLQYRTDATGTNLFRVAATDTAGFRSDSWTWWDYSPAFFDSTWTDVWFDYPDAALSDGHLWLTFNQFDTADDWQRALVFRFDLNVMAAGNPLAPQWWATTENGSLRLSQGAGATMYWTSQQSNAELRVFRWEDGGNVVNWWDVPVTAWSGMGQNGYSAALPDGTNWLSRADPRVTACWTGSGVIGAAWSVDSDSGHPWPFVRIARVNESTMSVIDEPDLWSDSGAWAYPAAAANDRGEPGLSTFFGGGTRNPMHIVALYDGPGWRIATTAQSTNGPADEAWGDYVTCHRSSPAGATWVAAGYTLQNGSDREAIEPRLVHFGREADRP